MNWPAPNAGRRRDLAEFNPAPIVSQVGLMPDAMRVDAAAPFHVSTVTLRGIQNGGALCEQIISETRLVKIRFSDTHSEPFAKRHDLTRKVRPLISHGEKDKVGFDQFVEINLE